MPAADVLRLGIGRWADQAISLLICISALGAINGQIFTGSRIYYAMGNDHRLYAWLGRWNARRGTPVCSLLIQGAITLALSIWFGLTRDGFESMVKFTTPGFWFFLTLVGVSLFVLRRRDPAIGPALSCAGLSAHADPLLPLLQLHGLQQRGFCHPLLQLGGDLVDRHPASGRDDELLSVGFYPAKAVRF